MKKLSSIVTLIVIALMAQAAISKALEASKVVIALNCGSKTE
jgi:hypothetical protein